MIGVFEVLMSVEAAGVPGDEHVLMIDAEPVRICLEGEARPGVLSWDRVMVGVQGNPKLG